MPTLHPALLLPHERRVCRALDARNQAGLGEALSQLDGTPFGCHFRLDSLYAVGGEGVVFLCRDERDPSARLVAKIGLVPFHRPVDLSSNFLRRRREQIREEGRNLESSRSVFLPRFHGLFEFENRLLDGARSGEFAAPEPVLVMEWLPGFDLDVWLARVHRSDVPVALLRRNLDRVAVVLLKALVDLEERGFYYTDLRPANLRMMGRPERRIRLLDAGSLVELGDESGRFPHVPSYLPPEVLHHHRETSTPILPTAGIQAVMAGRTLYEVATGSVPYPGREIDRALLKNSHVSEPVADVIDGLATGSFQDVRPAMRYLEKRAVRRVPIPREPRLPVGGAAPAHPASEAVQIPLTPPVPHRPPVAARPALPPLEFEPLQVERVTLDPLPARNHAGPADTRRAMPASAQTPRPVARTGSAPAPARPAQAQRTSAQSQHANHAQQQRPAAKPAQRPIGEITQELPVLPPPRRRSWWRRLFGPGT